MKTFTARIMRWIFALLTGFIIGSASQTAAANMKIAFESNRSGNYEIYVMNADGTHQINLTRHPKADRHPDWSPDGTKIAFTSNQDGDFDIYVMDADGSNLVNLTQDGIGNDKNPSWQPIPLAVSSQEKSVTLWGRIKQNKEY